MESNIRKKAIYKELIGITTPVLFETVLGTLFGMVDMIMLGKCDVPEMTAMYLAAVGITNQMNFLGMSVVQALNTGGTAIIARYMGSKKSDQVQDVLIHIILITVFFMTIPIAFLGLKYAEPIMKFIGAEQETIIVGAEYFRFIIIGFIFASLNFAMSAAFRGTGDTRTPMRVNLIVNMLNVVGNAILIYGLFGFPSLKIKGAAISTMLSNAAAFVILSYKVLIKRDSPVKIELKRKFRFKKSIWINLLRIGAPAAGEMLAFRVGVLLFIQIVTSLGTVVYATHQVFFNILSLSYSPGQSFGIAASTLVGRSLGSNDEKRAEEYMLAAEKIGGTVGIGMGVVMFFFGAQIAGLYNDGEAIIVGAASVLRIMAFIQPLQASQLIIAGGLRGAGDTAWTLVSTFSGVLVVRTIIAYIFVFVFEWGLIGAWMGMLCDQLMRWILVKYRFRTGKWKTIKLNN